MTTARTYFGHPVLDGKLVRRSEIDALPFAEFWRESAIGSTMLGGEGGADAFVYLHDRERFARFFIETGRHRYMPLAVHVE